MANGDAFDVSDNHARSDEAAAAELNGGFARRGSAAFFDRASPAASTVRYGAFISYSHAANAEVARGLQKWLQTYAKPWWRWRAVNVFRDETDLTAAPALWSRIADALDQSSHFILLASPEAAQSKWIKREVRYWLGDQNAGSLEGPDLDAPIANPKPERVATLLIALTAGDMTWDEKAGNAGDFDWTRTSALPRQLSGVFGEEPQWVDLTTVVQREHLRASLSRSNAEFMQAVAQLAAPIRGIGDFSRLVSEDYHQYRRTIRTAWAAAAVLACVSAVALWQWRTAVVQRDRAVHAEAAANRANAEAQANAEQAKANAAEAKANAETAKANLREAQIGQSRFLADQASQRRTQSDIGTAVLLALEALPDAGTGVERPYVPEAELQLVGARRDLRERLILSQEQAVLSAAFSPDGERIVTASSDKTARIWDAQSGRSIGEALRGHTGQVLSAAFSPDGKRIVTASDDKTACIWDAATGQLIGEPLRVHTLRGHELELSSPVFSPDGTRIVAASEDEMVRIWDAETGEPIGKPFKSDVGSVRSARLWAAATGGQPLRTVSKMAAFSPDGKRIVTSAWGKTPLIWDAATDKPIGELRGHTGLVASLAFSPDGKTIVTASSDGTARIWDAATGRPIGEALNGHDGYVFSAAFSPDGKRIVTASWDKTARVWDVASGQLSWLLPLGVLEDGDTYDAEFSPDGKRIVTASDDKTARLWDAETGQPIGEPLRGHEDTVLSAKFSPDGKRIVTASADKTARLWDARTGQPVGQPLRGHGDYVSTAAFSPDGNRIVTASADKTARLWDATTGQPIGEPLRSHEDSVASAAFSPDGKSIVTASDDKTARLWDATTGQPIGQPLIGHEKGLSTAAFSPDGKRIVTASGDDTARVWDAATGLQDGEPLIGHRSYLTSAEFSPDGKRIVTASGAGDRTVRLWDAVTGKPIVEPFEGHSSDVRSAVFSPDGQRIVTASRDRTARIWKVVFPETEALVSAAKAAIPRCLTQSQRTAFFLPPEPSAWCVEMAKWPYNTPKWKEWLANKRAGKNPPLPAAQ